MNHATNQIAIFDTERQKLEQQQQSMTSQPPPLIQGLQGSQQMIPSLMNNVNILQASNRNDGNASQNLFPNQNYPNQQQFFPAQQMPPPQQQLQHEADNQFQGFNLPPPAFSIPDLSRPPPGFNNSPSAESSPHQAEPIEEAEPQPFFLLPAGLMVSLIGLESCNYQGLDPTLIKLPPPTPPTEKLLSAVEAYYSAPSHERPRDTEGWEKLGLYEYFKIKNSVRKQKEEAVARSEREKSKSPSPIPESLTKPEKKQRKRAYCSKSPEAKTSRSKSRSMSPESRPTLQVSASRSRSKKKSRTPSPSPNYRFNRESRIDRRRRSVTPPSFIGAASKVANEFIDEGNKGHQMLKKLGWTSGGLGAGKNQGIAEPISGGEFRDKSNLYKVSSSPFPLTSDILIF